MSGLLNIENIEPVYLNDDLRKVYVYRQCSQLNTELEIIKIDLEKTDPNTILLKEAYLLSITNNHVTKSLVTVLFGRIKKPPQDIKKIRGFSYLI